MSTPTQRSDRARKIRTAIRILNVRLRFIILMILTGVVAAKWDAVAARWERWTTHAPAASGVAASEVEYYCPMHPSVVRNEPGNCPICGMPLSKRQKGEAPTLPEGVIGRLELSPERLSLAGVATSEVGYRSLHREIHAFGSVEAVERRIANISARVGGRIERVFADYPDGQVNVGEPLVELYSPDLISTEQEYLIARRSGGSGAAGGSTGATGNATGPADDPGPLAGAARERLRLWGVADQEIAALEKAGTPSPRLVIRSPVRGTILKRDAYQGQYVMEGTELYTIADLSELWVTANIPELDASAVRRGMPVEAEVTGFPGKTFTGEVDFIEPVFGTETRTLRIRTRVGNPGGELRPGMYAEISIQGAQAGGAKGTFAMAQAEQYQCPMKCDNLVFSAPGRCPVCNMELVPIKTAPTGEALAVPETAIIDTGTRKVAYRESEPGVFDAVEVTVGPLEDGWYPVVKGLSAGDRVVTRGTFLVDAELRLSPGAASSYFGATGGPSASAGSAPASTGAGRN